MEVKEFFEEYKRMVKDNLDVDVIKEMKISVNAITKTKEDVLFDISVTNYNIEKVIEWAKSNPKKTIADDFFEKHSDAKCFDDGTPKVCAAQLGYCTDCRLDDYGDRDCYSCWNMPVK